MAFVNNSRFKKFENKVWLSSPTMYPDSMRYVMEAYETNWMSTVGKNINEVEKVAAETSGTRYAVALSCGTAALHLCMKLAGERLYGKPPVGVGALNNRRVFCTDMTFNATLNPVVYEGGIPVFIDTEYDSWGMDPVALEKAFFTYGLFCNCSNCSFVKSIVNNLSLFSDIHKKSYDTLIIYHSFDVLFFLC